MTGKLILFEGPDGVGKTTLSQYACQYLTDGGGTCELISFPGKEAGTLGRVIYDLHHYPENFGIRSMTPAAVQTLHIAAHIDAIERKIIPLLRAGTHIVLDRYWWSTWVYGVTAGITPSLLQALIAAERVSWNNNLPDLAILVTVEKPRNRKEDLSWWKKLRDSYQVISVRESLIHPVITLDNSDSLELTLGKLRHELEQLIG